MLEHIVNLVSYVYDSTIKSEQEDFNYDLKELYCSAKSIFDLIDQLQTLVFFNEKFLPELNPDQQINRFLSGLKDDIGLCEIFVLDLARNLSLVEIDYKFISIDSGVCMICGDSYLKKRLFQVDKKRQCLIARKIKFVRNRLKFDERVMKFETLEDITIFTNKLKDDLATLKNYRLKMKDFLLKNYELKDLF